jgi:hypothetical protein
MINAKKNIYQRTKSTLDTPCRNMNSFTMSRHLFNDINLIKKYRIVCSRLYCDGRYECSFGFATIIITLYYYFEVLLFFFLFFLLFFQK